MLCCSPRPYEQAPEIDRAPLVAEVPGTAPKQRDMQRSQDGYEKDEKYQGFKEDVYAFMATRFLEFLDPETRRLSSCPALRLLHAVLLYLVNAVVQVSLTYVLFLRTSDAKQDWISFEKSVDQSARDAAETVMRAATAGQNLTEPFITMCTTQIESQKCIIFYYFMVFVWFARMTAEFQSCVRDMKYLSEIRTADLKVVRTEKGEVLIKAMAQWQKILLFCSSVLIRFFIAAVIMYSGGKFIILQTGTVTIIIKALAMQLVIGIDEMFFHSFVTLPNISSMKKMKMAVPAPEGSARTSL